MKPVLLESRSFIVTDHRRSKDFQDTNKFRGLLSLFKDNAEAWEELISLILEDDEFNTPSTLTQIEIRLTGTRKSFLGKANRTNGYIKMTPQSAMYHEGQVTETFLHELGHIAVPTESSWNGRRIVHGARFKEVTYKIAQYAETLGLLSKEQVRLSLGKACHDNLAQAVDTPTSPAKFHVGDTVKWTWQGHKHGGEYTGVVRRVNRKTYTVIESTKDGIVSSYGMKWRFGKNSSALKFAE